MVRAIVSDNHYANVLPYKLLLMELDHVNDDLEYDYWKFCLLHDTLHLIKNVKNNSWTTEAWYFQLLNTMVLKIQFHVKVVKLFGTYFTM